MNTVLENPKSRNAIKPMLADVLKMSRDEIIGLFLYYKLDVFEHYYGMSVRGLAEQFIEKLDSKNIC
jgi:hypothetical protein